MLTDFVEGGELRRGFFLGVELDETDLPGGALIAKVIPGSAASRRSEKDDLILAVGPKRVNSVNQTRVAISQTAPDTKLPIKIARGGVTNDTLRNTWSDG